MSSKDPLHKRSFYMFLLQAYGFALLACVAIMYVTNLLGLFLSPFEALFWYAYTSIKSLDFITFFPPSVTFVFISNCPNYSVGFCYKQIITRTHYNTQHAAVFIYHISIYKLEKYYIMGFLIML